MYYRWESRGSVIVQGSVGKNHVHILISRTINVSISKKVQCLKGGSSRLIQDEFAEF